MHVGRNPSGLRIPGRGVGKEGPIFPGHPLAPSTASEAGRATRSQEPSNYRHSLKNTATPLRPRAGLAPRGTWRGSGSWREARTGTEHARPLPAVNTTLRLPDPLLPEASGEVWLRLALRPHADVSGSLSSTWTRSALGGRCCPNPVRAAGWRAATAGPALLASSPSSKRPDPLGPARAWGPGCSGRRHLTAQKDGRPQGRQLSCTGQWSANGGSRATCGLRAEVCRSVD